MNIKLQTFGTLTIKVLAVKDVEMIIQTGETPTPAPGNVNQVLARQ